MTTPRDMNDFLSGIDLAAIEAEEEAVRAAIDATVDLAAAAAEVVNLPARHIPAPSPWNPRLPFDIALGEEIQVLCDRYLMTEEELDALKYLPSFRHEVAKQEKDIRENGVTFKAKARVQAELYLETLDELVNNHSVSPATRLDAIKSVVKWGGLEPLAAAAGQSSIPTFNIQINL